MYQSLEIWRTPWYIVKKEPHFTHCGSWCKRFHGHKKSEHLVKFHHSERKNKTPQNMINITCPTIRITFDKFNKKHFRAFHSPKILHFSRIGFAFRKIGNDCQNGKIPNILGRALLTSWVSSAWATKQTKKKEQSSSAERVLWESAYLCTSWQKWARTKPMAGSLAI